MKYKILLLNQNDRITQTMIMISYIVSSCSVLTDPNKRIIYDMFGEEGLSTSWDVAPRSKTPQEVGTYQLCQFF